MVNFRRRRTKPSKEGSWNTPKYYLKDRENINRPRTRKKPCKATKAEHNFQIKSFKLKSNEIPRNRLFRGVAFFDLDIAFRCPCGKKPWHLGIWNY